MAERFNILQTLDSKQFSTENSAVQISAARILGDTQNGQRYLQVKFVNNGEQPITGLDITVKSGDAQIAIQHFTDFNLKYGETSGSKTLIALPTDADFSKLTIVVSSIMYAPNAVEIPEMPSENKPSKVAPSSLDNRKLIIVAVIAAIIVAAVVFFTNINRSSNAQIDYKSSSSSFASSSVTASETSDAPSFVATDYTGYWFNGSHSSPYYIGIIPYGASGIDMTVYYTYGSWHFVIPDLSEAHVPSAEDSLEYTFFNYENGTYSSFDGQDNKRYLEGLLTFNLSKDTVDCSEVSEHFNFPITEDEFNQAVSELAGSFLNQDSSSTSKTSSDWKQAYCNYISTDATYCLDDLDGNGIPELFEFFGDSYSNIVQICWYDPGNGVDGSDVNLMQLGQEGTIFYVKETSYSTVLASLSDGYYIGQFSHNNFNDFAFANEYHYNDGSNEYYFNSEPVTEDDYYSLQNQYMTNLVGSNWWDVKNEAYGAYSASEIKSIINSY